MRDHTPTMTSSIDGEYQTEFNPSTREASIALVEAIADAENVALLRCLKMVQLFTNTLNQIR